ncbi:MAG: radical SAM family heme chaperone HemW [Lentisphaeria bacterium]|nr:radical SAM family heme chaperone HemW [Lentisphaeria bacterium]
MNYYFHIPFCASKCGYCAFYSIPEADRFLIDSYLDQLERTLHSCGTAETVYIGGGTPTYLSAVQLKRLFAIIRSGIDITPETEISCEANPESITPEKCGILRENITRISMGVQSFDAAVRKNIGRHCSGKVLEDAITLIRSAGFPHWNMDLIFALPGQSDESFFAGAEMAVEYGVDHISCYALTAEENAALKLPEDDEHAAEMMPEICDFMNARGFRRYEISNFARPGCECRHNCNVWKGGRLAGFGPAACGFDGTDRWSNGTLDEWLTGRTPMQDAIPHMARLQEIFAVNLRTADGWTPDMWAEVPNADSWARRLEIIREIAANFPAEWFDISAEHIALTGNGMMFWNSVAGEIFDHGA